MNTIAFTLPSCPPSCNSLYEIIYSERRVRLKPEVLEWKTRAKLYIKHFPESISEESIVRVNRIYYYPWFDSKGGWIERDSANMDKALFDTIAEKLGFRKGDTRFKWGEMKSYPSRVERVEVMMIEIERGEWDSGGGELEVVKA